MKETVDVEAYQMQGGKWGVRTSFLKMPVGDYLGQSEGLDESEARDLARQWDEMQRRSKTKDNLELFKVQRAKKSKYLKQGE